MGFSLILEIGSLIFDKHSALKIRESTDGFGVSGVCTSELTFTVPYEEYLLHVPFANADVKIYAGENYKIAATYYISSRSRKGGMVSFKCYDKMIFTNQTIVFEDNDFKNDMIDAFWLLEVIRSQCGFEAYGVIGITELADISIPREKVEGRSCYECLQLLSSAWCGFFKVSNDDKLTFVPFGMVASTISDDISKMRHAAVSEGNIKGPITQVIMSGGNETFLAGNNGADVFNTLKISSDLASQELANNIMERIENYTYQSWECSKIAYGNDIGLIDVMGITAEILFADGIWRTANYIEKTITAYGLFVSCGANEVTENEFDYIGKLSREISNKISDGEKLGNETLVTRYQGIIHLGEKEKSKGRTVPEPVKRYGYAPATYEGVVKFDGAMVDKALPEITVKDDLSGFSTVYGDTVIDYELEWVGDNVTLKEKEAAQ